MKTTIILTLLIVCGIVLFIASCKPKKDLQQADMMPQNCLMLSVDANFFEKNTPSKNVNIDSASIVGDCLELSVKHGGGCPKKDDVYSLVWNKKVLKSFPPQVVLQLHLESDDMCKKMVHKKVAFDLSTLREVNPKGEVIIRIRNFEERLSYNFNQTETEK